MRRFFLAALAAMAMVSSAAAADKGTRFWNLTTATVAKLYVSAAGANAYGPNQCANDNDGTVDASERLKVNVPAGKSDVKVAFEDGKVCIVRNVDIVAGGVFSIEDKDLTSCSK
jgi:hypothetical protein